MVGSWDLSFDPFWGEPRWLEDIDICTSNHNKCKNSFVRFTIFKNSTLNSEISDGIASQSRNHKTVTHPTGFIIC